MTIQHSFILSNTSINFLSIQSPEQIVALIASLPRAGKVEAPIPDVEHGEHKGEEDPGEDVNLLGLELEVLEPQEKSVSVPDRKPVEDICQYK